MHSAGFTFGDEQEKYYRGLFRQRCDRDGKLSMREVFGIMHGEFGQHYSLKEMREIADIDMIDEDQSMDQLEFIEFISQLLSKNHEKRPQDADILAAFSPLVNTDGLISRRTVARALVVLGDAPLEEHELQFFLSHLPEGEYVSLQDVVALFQFEGKRK